jgi:peptidoglycan/xylan/chitin deacetylase (PgdA/CDA1 family)
MKAKIIILLLTILTILTGCINNSNINQSLKESGQAYNTVIPEQSDKSDEKEEGNKEESDNENDNENINIEEEQEEPEINPVEAIDLSLKPNEAGKIMVLMYHGIGNKESDWVRTVENFKKDLEVLYEKGYRPISLRDFVNNNIDIEAGYTPIVITFDDGLRNNFNIIEEDGEKIIDPNCAVGILEEFHRNHSDFPITATFFIFGTNPFRQKELVEYKLNYLIENGYDVGNHTYQHDNFTRLGPEGIQEAIGKNVAFLNGILKDYSIDTLALPYGSRPKREYYKYLQRGAYENIEYENIAILDVGSNPSVSPIDKRFNPYAIPRVRASEMNVKNVGMYNWLEYFDKNPEARFISDGNPDIVTVPKKYEGRVDKERIKDKYLYIYEEETN